MNELQVVVQDPDAFLAFTDKLVRVVRSEVDPVPTEVAHLKCASVWVVGGMHEESCRHACVIGTLAVCCCRKKKSV